MKDADRKPFIDLLTATMEVYGAKLGVQGIAIWWNSLSQFSFVHVRAALSAHVKDPVTGKFSPKPADLIYKIQMLDGRPGAEEAWAIAASVIGNESITIVWTEEMAAALGVARELEGDRVASRMAFIETYRAHVQRARDSGIPVKWSPCLGWDANGREAPLRDAVQKGRLTYSQIAGLLPYRQNPAPEIQQLINNSKRVA